MAKAFDEEHIKAHYEFLDHKKQTEIRVIVDSSEKENYSKEEWVKTFHIKSYEELLSIVKTYSGKRHIYIGINERKEFGSKISDIESITNFVIDIDNKSNLIETQQVALKIKDDSINQGFLEPLMISSGNGYHIYFALKPIDNNNDNREKIKSIGKSIKNKYQNDYCLIDEAVFEPARVMRLAGTMNTKKDVNILCTIANINLKRVEDELFSKSILSFEGDNSQVNSKIILPKEIIDLIKDDYTINRLFEGNIEGFESRSEAELSLVCRLIRINMTKEQIFSIMASCKIGKWQESHIGYRELSYKKALEIIIKEKETFKEKNPFKNLCSYETKHLPHFNEMNKLICLYGKHYLPIKKARWYQLIGGIIQKQIYLGEKITDTRIHCVFPLPTEQGKNDLIYLNKNIVSKVRKIDECFKVEEPISYHPEQLVGKVIEVMIDNPNGNKPKQIKIKQENRGYFDADFVEIDEANSLFFNNDEQTKTAREYISKALNPIGRNEVVKKSVDDLPDQRVSYFPSCTFSLYHQPKKISEDLILQGFLRRFLIPCGNIQPFLNYGNQEEFSKKTNSLDFSRNEVANNLIGYLDDVRAALKNKDFVFSNDAIEKINFYHKFLIIEGQVHSEKIANLTKLIKWTIQDYLIRMSCIIAGAYKTNMVDENYVALAFMDLVELLQSTFDYLDEWVIGSFDYGLAWQGAKFNEKICLEYLYSKDCYSEETSSVSINEFQNYIGEVFGVQERRAREIFSDFKRNNWIKSKQVGKDDSKVWLGFIPETQNLIYEGGEGGKGGRLYKNIVSSLNTILEVSPPSPPLPPSPFKES